MKQPPAILRLKITLEDVEPPIWRSIEIPASATLWALHVAIQDAMGWVDCHLHEFHVGDRSGETTRIGIPDDDGWGEPAIPGWKRKLSPVFRRHGDRVRYLYDFGDGWEHTVELESIGPAGPKAHYPRCLEGRRRCPPEDCGGPLGYEELLEVLANPSHPEHAHFLEWVGGPFDPEAFNVREVVFEDPEERRKYSLGLV